MADTYGDLSEYLHDSDSDNDQSTPSTSVTINVPQNTNSIQRTIDASLDNDTIVVSPGRYNESIDFKGKVIKVTNSPAYDFLGCWGIRLSM